MCAPHPTLAPGGQIPLPYHLQKVTGKQISDLGGYPFTATPILFEVPHCSQLPTSAPMPAQSFATYEYLPSEYDRQRLITKFERLRGKLAQVCLFLARRGKKGQ